MIGKAVLEALKGYVREENIFLQEPMAAHTTFRVGGPAECLVIVETVEELVKVQQYLKKVEIPYVLLGNGSNVLVSDEGLKGIVLKFGGELTGVTVEGTQITAGAGATLAQVAAAARKNSLTGLEFAAGIPGTVGGGVVMNAGAYGGELKQVVKTVTLVSPEGELLTLDNASMEFGYRTSILKKHPFLAVEVTFELKEGKQSEITALMEDLAFRRRDKQPLEFPSAGSTFKRPEGYFAGALIEQAGFRGFKLGGAQVSEKHCGFVINAGGATAEDVARLIKVVRDGVKEKFGVLMEPEVIFLGHFETKLNGEK